jgi:hypothetical protein
MYHHIVALFFAFPLFLSAQPNNSGKANNTDWTAESTAYLYLDQQCEASPQDIDISILKLVQKEPNYSNVPFTDAIIQLFRTNTWSAFKDIDCKTPISASEVITCFNIRDTITTFDPLTYEEKIVIVENDLLQSVRHFKIKQRLFFDESNNSFSASLVAIAPVVSLNEGIESTPVWYKVPAVKKKKYTLDSKKIIFATQLEYFTEERDIQTQRGNSLKVKQTMIERLKSGVLTGYDEDLERIPLSDVEQLFLSADTIYTFDPETYEERFDVVEQEFRAEDVSAFKLQQTWYFDPQNASFYNQLDAIAPAVAITDKSGTLSHYFPLFFWRKE